MNVDKYRYNRKIGERDIKAEQTVVCDKCNRERLVREPIPKTSGVFLVCPACFNLMLEHKDLIEKA